MSRPWPATPVRGPVFVTGLDRSGKTTMAAFLTSHPAVAVPPVGTNLWRYFYRRFGDLARRDNLERCLDVLLRYGPVQMLEPDAERLRDRFGQGPATYDRLFGVLMEGYAERQGKPRWGVQTGLVERHADHVLASYPGARMVHMLRDPRDRYAAALARSPGSRGRAGAAVARWRYSLALAERHLRRHPAAYLLVRYEDLVCRTEETLRRVCRFLGEPFVPEMLAMVGATERRSRLAASAGTAPGAPVLTPAFIGRFLDTLDPGEVTFLQLHAGAMMRAYGYRPVPLRQDATQRLRFAAVDWPGNAARMVGWRAQELLQERFPRVVPRPLDVRFLDPAPVPVR